MTRPELAALRSGLPQCELLALIDASTEMTLAVDSALWRAQENLDALCAQAVRLLLCPSVENAETCWVATPFGLSVFYALPGPGQEVLCGLLSPMADPFEVLDAFRQVGEDDHGGRGA